MYNPKEYSAKAFMLKKMKECEGQYLVMTSIAKELDINAEYARRLVRELLRDGKLIKTAPRKFKVIDDEN